MRSFIIVVFAALMGLPIGAAENNIIPSTPTNWRASLKSGDTLPAFVQEALKYVPTNAKLRKEQVVVVDDLPLFLAGYLTEILGYPQSSVAETYQEVREMSEFTLNQQFPVFVVSQQDNYKQLEELFGRGGETATRAAMVLASDLWHEWQHAALGADEVQALKVQISFLRELGQSNPGLAVNYLRLKEKALAREQRASMRAALP